MKKILWDWVGIIGGIAAVLAGAFVVIKAGGPQSIYIAIAMIVIFGSLGLIIYRFIWKPKFNIRRLQKSGIPAKAKVLEVRDTGIAINNNPQVKLVMEIKNNLGQVYTTTCKTIVSRRNPGYFKPGMEVLIKIDPKNKENVIIEDSRKS